ncbi:MAG TPA: thioredoxin domain-containing protein [Acidobacteriaceae bacterium]|nr:thioredoxin domain-containing protein [Acidobacteriaceae bacterium]
MRLTNMNTLRRLGALALLLPLVSLPAVAQKAAPPGTGDPFKDTAYFHPPAGEKIAIIEFQDLECPACAHAFPIVHAAVAHYGIPLYEKDFPLRQHIWSFDAAIWARYLQDKVSLKVADEYRGAIFAAQQGIASKDDMLAFTRRFFSSHGIQAPFVIDPTGALTKEVVAERTLGEKIGLQHTPTIIVCTAHEWVQVTDTNDLYQTIDQLLATVGGSSKPTVKHTSAKKH